MSPFGRFWRTRSPGYARLPPGVRTWLDHKPDLRRPWRLASWTALDLETTGLDASRDAIVAVGLVDIEGGRIRLDTAWQTLVRPPAGTEFRAESVRVHGLTPERVAAAPEIGEVLPTLMGRLAGRIPIGHKALDFDAAFVTRALQQAYGIPFAGPLLDTARLGEHLGSRVLHLRYGAVSTRLADLARQYGLCVYREHDALADALTCAQLFLVMATRMEALGSARASQIVGAR